MDIYQINEYLKNSNSDFFNKLQQLIKEMGFDYCAYGVKPINTHCNRSIKLISNYDNEWKDNYSKNNYIDIDPVVIHSFSSTQPLIWEAGLFEGNQDFWEEAKEFNINSGFSHPSRDLSGRIGVLTFAGSYLNQDDIMYHAPILSWISQLAHIELADIIMPINEKLIKLSEREKDILRFTSEGRTTPEIAALIFITESGVNYHFVNIFRKLSVKNKQEAVAKSLLFNLLY